LPEVSVIIPSFNRSHMLGDAVRSVLGQSFTDFELIVVDDGSTDDTAGVLSCWAGQLEVIKTRRRGVSASRNLGAGRARGQWLAFLDSDDLWLPEKLELQLQAHHRQPDFLISHTDEFWVRQGVRVNPMKKHAKRGGAIFEYSLPICRISPSSVLIDRELFSQIGGFDTHYRVCEDYELWLRITAHYPVLYLDRKLVVKRGGHADQLSSSHWGFDRYRVRAILKILGSGILHNSQRLAALKELEAKSHILALGYGKRNKKLQAARYRRLEKWAGEQSAQSRPARAAER
jgi:glycosyltransferase involved in cell wall biosynthesis